MLNYLEDSLFERAQRASQEGDYKTLSNLRSFALRAGHLDAETLSTVSAMIVNALTIQAVGSTIRAEYEERSALLWYEELSALRSAPLYAQAALILLAAREARCAPPARPIAFELYLSCY